MRAIRIVVAMALVLVAMPLAAQGRAGGGMGGGMGQLQQRQNEMLFKDITLSEAQRAKVDSLQAANREALMGLMMGGGGMQDPETREKLTAMRDQHNKDIRAVLTPEQQVQFDKNLAEMPQAGGMGGGRRPPPQR